MANRKKRFREEFLFVILVLLVVAFALIADWWEENLALGWLIITVALIALIAAFIGIRRFRATVKKSAKNVTQRIIYEDEVLSREPVPGYKRREVMKRAKYRCENIGCNKKDKPHIHHVDMKNNNNDWNNLCVLCPECHTQAHRGKYTGIQIRNWIGASRRKQKDEGRI